MFQEKTWCDEDIMKEWINTEWSNPFTNPIRSKNILIADVHRAKQADSVKALPIKKVTSVFTRMYIARTDSRFNGS